MRKLFALLCITAILTAVSSIGCKKEEETPADTGTTTTGGADTGGATE